ncbi:MAG: NAD(P)H-hydrate dehydratase [Candidatus Omnitrophica bacterium]|nr:NAD(P)H-hydrate dehydratase [Candidatus Omnitrophota bacterium]
MPAQLLQRRPAAHKGELGHILILAGCLQYSGAAVLSSAAAMRSGAGLVTLGIPKGICAALIKRKYPEVMLLPLKETPRASLSIKAYSQIKDFLNNIDVLIIGPGLSRDKSTQALVRRIVFNLRDKPVVIDADGLNALAGHLKIKNKKLKIKNAVVTPHPGEMARLLGMSVRSIQLNRKEFAKKFAKACEVTVVLKGNNTVVADYQGKIYINKTGNPGMASAGSGDVLTGIIAAFLAQGLSCFNAAKYAVYLHGLAGDLAAGSKTQLGMIATDIIDKIPQAIKKCS